MNIYEYLANRIKDLREKFNHGEGLSQEALAAKLNVASNTISRWETGTYKPKIEDLDKLARFFGVSILKFFPPEETENNSTRNEDVTALLRTAKELDPHDLKELRSYAEFRLARSLYEKKPRPKAGRKKTEK
jgi:transcriptional regulator with XRE-family HTH domain